MFIVINNCYGGFSLSKAAVEWLAKNGHLEAQRELKTIGKSRTPVIFGNQHLRNIIRSDPLLIKCIRTLRKKADGGCAKLKIVKIPDNIDWEIEEYDGIEWVSEKHRTWH